MKNKPTVIEKKKKGYAKYMYDIQNCPICGVSFDWQEKGARYNLFVGNDGYSCMHCDNNFANAEGMERVATEYDKNLGDYIFGGRGKPRGVFGKKVYPAIWEKI